MKCTNPVIDYTKTKNMYLAMTILFTIKARLKLNPCLIIIIIQTAFLLMLKPIITFFIFLATISLT